MLHTWIDGISADVVPVDDRGLNYADGVFETLLCKRGKILGAQLHEARLAQGLSRLTFPNADSLAEAVFATARQLLSGVGHSGIARLTVTRGSGKRGYTPDFDATPRSILVARNDRVIDNPASAAVRQKRVGLINLSWQVLSFWLAQSKYSQPARPLRLAGMTRLCLTPEGR